MNNRIELVKDLGLLRGKNGGSYFSVEWLMKNIMDFEYFEQQRLKEKQELRIKKLKRILDGL